ncbi:MAG: M14 family metallopeptidase [Mycobacteriales bacterium]|nr:M14 family metallopeptidase [Mycobacteriales bacterium]
MTTAPVPVETSETGVSRRALLRTAGAVAAAGVVATALPSGAATSSSVASPVAGAGGRALMQLARVWATTAKQRKAMVGFDDTHTVYEDGSVQYLLWPGDLARLKDLGLRFVIEVPDLALADALEAAKAKTAVRSLAVQPGETKTGDYRVLADYERDMRALAKKYPTKAKLIELPHRTMEGRTVYGLEICTNVSKRDGRPVFYQDGCHHAREWPASEVPIMWAYDLLENYAKDKRIKAIVDNVRTIIVPVVNVDSFHFTRSVPVETPGGLEGIVLGGQGAYTRKNRRPIGSTHISEGLGLAETEIPKELQGYLGVDPNRNYAYQWGDDEGGSSPSMTDQTYRGTDPFSEAESRNVAHVLKSHQVTAMISHHTSGDLLLWAWGDTRDDAPDNDLLEGLGRAMAVYNGYRPQKSIDLYVTTGTTSDYAYGALGSIGYTFEHAGSSFHPPYPTTVPAMYAKNREAFILLATYGCIAPEKRPDLKLDADAAQELKDEKITSKRLSHAILSGRAVNRSGKPVAAKLSITKTFDTDLWLQGAKNPLEQKVYREFLDTSMETGTDGKFEWHVNPSTRPAKVAAKKTESYVLAITGPKGSGISKRIVVKRGQRIKLGDVVVD